MHENLLAKDFYNFPYKKFIFEQIERKQSKETVDFDNLTVEHIMPQTLTTQWMVDLGRDCELIHEKKNNTLGHLTLTGYNSELSNDPFLKKKEIYKESNISITKILADFDQWNENSIAQRAEFLIGEIEKIWKCPDEIRLKKSNFDDQTEFDFSDDVNVTGRKPTELIVCGEKFNVESWRELFEIICQKMYEYDPQRFRNLTHLSRIISVNGNNLTKPYKISDNLYIEENLSEINILNTSKLILEKFDEMLDVYSFSLRPQKD